MSDESFRKLEDQLFNEKERVEEHKREIESRDELIAGADFRNAELQAEAAAMRNTLEALDRLGGLGYQKHDWIKAALVPNAGKMLLERLEKAERKCRGLEEIRDQALEGISDARAQAIEEAAKVAEECDWLRGPNKYGSLRETIAAAIRALASKQPVPSQQHHQENEHHHADNAAGVPTVTGTGSPRGNGQSAQGENNQDNEQDGHAAHTKHSGKETP